MQLIAKFVFLAERISPMEIAIPLLLIAVVFLIWKLNDVLGTQRGHLPVVKEKSEGALKDKVNTPANDVNNFLQAPQVIPAELIAAEVDTDLVIKGLEDIMANDRQFQPSSFLNGAILAFDMIMSAFASGNRDDLSSLVSKEVFDAFDRAIKDREEKNQNLRFTVLEEPIAKFESAEFGRGMAYIGVQICSVQNGVTYDSEENIVSGSPDRSDRITNHWMFSRQVNAKDPNWTLIKTAI